MATCKDCLHFEACKSFADHDGFDLALWTDKYGLWCSGENYKDRSQFVELPCKVGDQVYVITYCRCRDPECYKNRHCHKKETQRTPKALDGVMIQQKGKKHTWNKDTFEGSWEWEPIGTICYRVYQRPFNVSMLPHIGHKVFLTLDEAKKGLVLCACSDDGKRSEDGK